MKKIKINQLHFKKYSIVELNKIQLYEIYGGSQEDGSPLISTIPTGLTFQETTTAPKVMVSVHCNM